MVVAVASSPFSLDNWKPTFNQCVSALVPRPERGSICMARLLCIALRFRGFHDVRSATVLACVAYPPSFLRRHAVFQGRQSKLTCQDFQTDIPAVDSTPCLSCKCPSFVHRGK